MQDKHEKDTKGLVVVFLLLLFVVVGLVVAIVVVLIMNREPIDELGNDNLAKECLKASGDTSIKSCLEDKAMVYYEKGDCKAALRVYDDVPVESFDEHELLYLYDDAYSMSLDCDDESLQSYWKDKLESLSSQSEARD